jgi:replicative DNA helicase
MLIDGDAVARAIETVDDSAFYREANRRVYRAMVRLYSRGEVIDVVTLSDELKSAGEREGAGGMAYLARLVDAVPTSANIE